MKPADHSIFSSPAFPGRRGFTLIEILVAVTILAVVMTVTCLTFSTATMAWRRGVALSDDLHHGDFVVEQLVMALRSAYYPDVSGESDEYGFIIEDNGDDEFSSDRISWVKLGGALVGKHCSFAGSPHRVEFFVEEDDDGESAAAVKFWRVQGQTEEFDPEELEPVWIARKITGFNCRMQDPEEEIDEDTDEIAWLDEWEDTNRVPMTVELTLWMEPLDDDEPAVEMKRIVQIPTAHLSWGGGRRTPTSRRTGRDKSDEKKTDESERSDPSDKSDRSDKPERSGRPGGNRLPTGTFGSPNQGTGR